MVAISAYLGYYLALRFNGSYMLQLDEWIIFIHLMVGTLLSSAGACTLNQAIEYKSDLKMERTKERAIPKGYISPLSSQPKSVCPQSGSSIIFDQLLLLSHSRYSHSFKKSSEPI
mgnify:CR=1 FL=1